jgi:TP901 family phage tail tape measure protein
MMADVANLTIEVNSSGVSRATTNLNQLETQGERTSVSTGRLTARFRAAGLAAGVASLAFAGFATARSARDISDFTQAIADLSAITGATGDDLQFYAESAKEIGRSTSLSASQAVQAFKLIGSAKPDLLANAAALEAVTKSAVTLAEASGILLPEAASALGSALNQFGLDASKADEVINLLAASSKFGAAEIPAVTEALRNVGSAANALDVDIGQTIAGIQALAIAGIQGADAGTSLRQILIRLEKTGDKNLQPTLVGLTGALTNLKNEGRSTAQLLELFGEEAFRSGVALLEQSDKIVILNENLRGTQTAVEQASIRMDTLEGDSKELSSAIEGLSIEFGEKLEPSLRQAAQALTDFVNEVTELISGKSSVKSLEAELASLESTLEGSFFGRSAKANKSNLRIEIEAVRAELLAAKADAGDLGSIEALISSKRAELTSLRDSSGSGRVAAANRKQISDLSAEIATLEAALVQSTEKAAQTSGSSDTVSENIQTQSQGLKDVIDRYSELLPLSERYNRSLRTPLEIYRDEIVLLNELNKTRIKGSEEALLSNENFARGSAEALNRFNASLDDSIVEFREFNGEATNAEALIGSLQTASEGFAASFADALIDGGVSFENFANGILKQLQKIALEKAFAPVFGAFSKGLGDIGKDLFGVSPADFIGPMRPVPSADGGGFTGSGPRSGGVDGKGGFNAILHPNETVIDHTKGQGMRSSNNIVVNVDASGSNSSGDADGQNLGNLIGIAVRSVLIEESRPGGMLA